MPDAERTPSKQPHLKELTVARAKPATRATAHSINKLLLP
jgi:hypothetical protein